MKPLNVIELAPPHGLSCDDDRFRKLVGQEWNRLPKAIRKRFGKRLRAGASVVYQGIVTDMRMNWAGWCLAQVARLVGAPLPFDMSSVNNAAVVVVTEDAASGGQFWIRQYGRKNGFPQSVHSSKRFAGPTGLEEYIGYGIGMALRVEAYSDALLFKSDHFFLQLGSRRVRWPRAMSPGALVIGHRDLGNGTFAFTLSLKSRLFGELIAQDAVFQDAKE